MEQLGEIIALQISNLRCIKFANLTFDPKSGELITIAGPNDAGKSTILDAIKFAIEGAAQIPEGVIRHGLYTEGTAAGQPIDRSLIRVKTSNEYIIERVIRKNAKGEQVAELQVIKEGEGKLPSAQNLLWSMSSKFPDPTVVAELDGKALFKSIADMLNIDLDQYDQKIEEQKEIAKLARQRQARLGAAPEKPVGDKVEPVDAGEAARVFYELEKDFDKQNMEAEQLTKRKNALELRITELQEELTRTKDEFQLVKEDLEEFVPPDSGALNAAKNRMEQANELNAKAKAWELWEKDQEERGEAQKEISQAKENVRMIENARREALLGAPLPAGLYLEEGTVMAEQGISWDSLSTSRKLAAATEICINSIPKDALRYLYIQRGESLGKERKEQIAKIAKEHNVQVFMEVMSESEDGGTIVIKQGEIVESLPVEKPVDTLDIF